MVAIPGWKSTFCQDMEAPEQKAVKAQRPLALDAVREGLEVVQSHTSRHEPCAPPLCLWLQVTDPGTSSSSSSPFSASGEEKWKPEQSLLLHELGGCEARGEAKLQLMWSLAPCSAKCSLPPFLRAGDERADCRGTAEEKSGMAQAESRIVRLLSNITFPHSPDPFLLYLSHSHCRLISFLIFRLIFFRTARQHTAWQCPEHTLLPRGLLCYQ